MTQTNAVPPGTWTKRTLPAVLTPGAGVQPSSAHIPTSPGMSANGSGVVQPPEAPEPPPDPPLPPPEPPDGVAIPGGSQPPPEQVPPPKARNGSGVVHP